MSHRWMITVGVLEWVLGRSPADGSAEPEEIRDVDSDGAKLCLVTYSAEPEEGLRLTQSFDVAVPVANRDRALKVRELMRNPPDFDFGDAALIDFSTAGDGSLSILSDWLGEDDLPPVLPGPRGRIGTLGQVPRRFKKRNRKR